MTELEKTNQAKPTVKQRFGFLLRFVAQPLMFLAAGVTILALLGIAQRIGWISADDSNDAGSAVAVADVDYICPMMCTPPQKEPGRCPVCAMELVPASGGVSGGDERSVVVDAATRRVVNIQTASAIRMPVRRTIRAVGEIGYDEGKMKTISAYTTGRFDKMYVDYTGAVVKQGDRLAEFYSPDLHSAQAEYLQAATSVAGRESSLSAVVEANKRLQSNARLRLVELGMSDQQIDRILREGKAMHRLDVLAPIHGTVIERLAVEGEYVKEGQPVFRLADLSNVWLLLELFPADAAAVRYGQAVEAQLKSMPNRTFRGRIAFIDPEVNKQSRTVSVRVVLDNTQSLVRIGDYAKAKIEVPINSGIRSIYDPELANKWISPRHPHVVSDTPGPCKLCGIQMVPATELGFTDVPQAKDSAIVIPRNAVLSASNESIVYVETETGRFEIRRVVTGPAIGQDIVISKGLAEGEKVATSGNFLLDSQMQLAGNPSLIDPSRAVEPLEMIAGFSAKEIAEIQQLPDTEQSLAIEQIICPVTEYKLGSMGVPLKVEVDGKAIFVCCKACRADVVSDPDSHLAKIESYKTRGPSQATTEDVFEVPEIGDILPIDSADAGLPIIEPLGEGSSFEIEVPSFDGVVAPTGGKEE